MRLRLGLRGTGRGESATQDGDERHGETAHRGDPAPFWLKDSLADRCSSSGAVGAGRTNRSRRSDTKSLPSAGRINAANITIVFASG